MNASIKIAFFSIALLVPCSIFSFHKKEKDLTAENIRKVDQLLTFATSQSGENRGDTLYQAEQVGKDVFNLTDSQIAHLYKNGFDKSIDIKRWVSAQKQKIVDLRAEKTPSKPHRQLLGEDLDKANVDAHAQRLESVSPIIIILDEEEEKKRTAAQAPGKLDGVIKKQDEQILSLQDEIMALQLQIQEHQMESVEQPAKQPKEQEGVRILSQPKDTKDITKKSEQ